MAHAVAERLERLGERVKLLVMLDSYPFHRDMAYSHSEWIDVGLKFLGFQPEALKQKPDTINSLAQFLCDRYDILNMPLVQSLQKYSPNIVCQLINTVEHHLNLAKTFRPGRVKADTVLFAAEHSRSESATSVINQNSRAWWPHLQRQPEVFSLPCDHQNILQQHHAAVIGKEITRKLHRVTRAEPELAIPTSLGSIV